MSDTIIRERECRACTYKATAVYCPQCGTALTDMVERKRDLSEIQFVSTTLADDELALLLRIVRLFRQEEEK